MRTAIMLLLVVTLAGVARADRHATARRKQEAGAALILAGATLMVGGGIFAVYGFLKPTYFDDVNQRLFWGGFLMFGVGGLEFGIGMPLYSSGTRDLVRF